jgi:hypothetical protein
VGKTFVRLPGESRVASFDEADPAEAFCRTREEEARAVVNPFAGLLCVPSDATSMPEGVLCDWLIDHGIDPPRPGEDGQTDWAGWWSAQFPGWTTEQKAAAWRALDRVRFFRVVERPRRPCVYAVVEVRWDYNDEWFYPGAEGGATQRAYRSRERAEQECARLNAVAREQWANIAREGGVRVSGDNQFDMEDRLFPGQDPFAPRPGPSRQTVVDDIPVGTFTAEEVPFFEVVEIELEGVE